MKRKRLIVTISLIAIFVIIAIVTKPGDKKIKIEAVKAVWGNLVPDVNKYPGYFNQFMDYTSASVYIDDWIIIKRIRFKIGKNIRPIGFAAFGQVFIKHK